MEAIGRKLIALAEERQVGVAIVDLSNVDAIDSSVAGHMNRLGKTLKLVGVAPIFCGIRGSLAYTMVAAGVDLGEFPSTRDLKSALQLSFTMTGYELKRIAV